jgi:DNA excision repair protein ERCC-2
MRLISQHANPSAGKLIYCTRTVPEMNSVMEELATVLAYRAHELESQQETENTQPTGDVEDAVGPNTEMVDAEASPTRKKARRIYNGKHKKGRSAMGPVANGRGAGGSGVLALCLSSRRNMCVHDRVMAESDREAVDAACRNMTASWRVEAAQKSPGSVETCSYFDNFQAAGESTSMPSGVYDLEELQKWGKGRGWCPYYLTRRALNHANILVFNYQYMLDPKVAKMVSKELEAESIVVFDEAHNIDSVCIEALSVTINDRGLEYATRSLGRLTSEVSRQKATDNGRLQQEYQNLVNGLIDQGLLDAPANEAALGSVGTRGSSHAQLSSSTPVFSQSSFLVPILERTESGCIERSRTRQHPTC